MGLARNWTPEEEAFLQENWGQTTVQGIAKHLGRTVNAVKVRVARMGLGPYLENGEYVTFHQFTLALGYGGASDTYKLKSWVKNRGFPTHNKRRA